MPTPRYHGGAGIAPINLTSPAFQGLNTADAASILGPEWATTLNNAVFDDQGRPSTRNGWVSNTTTVYDGTEKLIKRVFEFWKADATSEIISSTDDNILTGVTDLSDATASIDGTLTITDGNIKFVNFNDKCIAFGIGTAGVPAVYTGTGTFTSVVVASGTAPTGTVGTSAFGRLWGVDTDGKTVRWSALLDETRWDVVDGGGSADFSRVWPSGQDRVVAIEELGGKLVIFGRNNTILLDDGSPLTLGLDPTQLFVTDTIPGIGAISQFAITRSEGDLWTISTGGLTSVGRELIQASAPIENISDNVQPDFLLAVDNEATPDDITLVHSPREGFVLSIFPTSQQVFMFESGEPLSNGGHRATTWSTALQTAAYIRGDKTLRGTLSLEGGGTTTGEIYTYSGFADDAIPYNFDYESGWLDLGQDAAAFLKFVKKIGTIVFVAANTTVTHSIGYDFGQQTESAQAAVVGGQAAEWGVFEWGANGSKDPGNPAFTAGVDVAEWSGGSVQLRAISVPGSGGGQYIRVGVSVDNNAAEFALQQINLFAKIGRTAT